MWRTALLSGVTAILVGSAVGVRVGRATGAGSSRPHPPSDGSSSADAPPRRIVSLVPSFTETCFALGLGERVVGRSTYCAYPPQAADLPDVGGLLDPNLERIVSLRPDLLLVPASGRDLRGYLDAPGLNYLALPNDTLDDVFSAIREIGRRCDRQAAAEALVARLHARVAAAQERAREGTSAAGARDQRRDDPGAGSRSQSRGQEPAVYGQAPVARNEPLRVMLSITASKQPMDPPWVAGPDSYLGSLLRLLGQEPVPEHLDRSYAQLSYEQVLRSNPDVIIEVRGLAGQGSVADGPAAAWGTLGPLRAARTGRVYVLEGAQHVTPGPRFVDTLDELVALLSRAAE